ncbi:CRE-PDFR-1 protein [Caenorhabditis remanei]|uniref:CRE-PDFR-1 protein n=1 Tax=Caenorhabditis remanei TaxID=31234 RepID=E3LST4_CAERE|nr:CRE-PDFR-1 protein [Caenorhabditis remanei]
MADSTSPFNVSILDNSTAKLSEMVDSGWNVLASTSVQAFNGAMDVLEESYPLCKKMLDHNKLFPERDPNDTRIWCNATYDTVLCWPPTPANSSVTLQCPHMKGLDPNKNITKDCHVSGVWSGRNAGEMGPTLPGWTNFTMCYTDEVIYIMQNLNNESLTIAQEVARNARKLEFVGLGLSLVSLILAISIFSYFRRLRVFRNLLHLHLMIAMLMVVIIRLVLYIDLIFTGDIGPHTNSAEGKTINTMPIVCEGMFFFLEYFKTVTFCWMFLEGIYLNNQIVFGFFNSEPKLLPYFLAGYGIPLIHTMLWLFVVLIKKDFKVERCLGSYYLEPEFWILDGPRMAELVINLFFICNVIRVLYSKVRESNNTSEAGLKKSVKAAMMLLPLLGVPNIMQTIPFAPTRDNIMVFAVWTYTASFTYMYQGLMVASIYCFTNKEVFDFNEICFDGKVQVNHVLKAFYARYRLLHKSQNELRRGSRSVASHYAAKNGTSNTNAQQTNNADETGKLSPFPSRSKKGSDDSTTKLMKDTVMEEEKNANNNGYGSAGEMTPLREGSNRSTKSP